jgi:SnoaL-like domain
MPTIADELEAIRHTFAAYNTAGDRMKLDALAATFIEDGVLETPTSTLRGRAGIAAGLGGGRGLMEREPAAAAVRRPTFVRHHLTTSLLDLTGPSTAEGRTYFIVFTDVGPDHAGLYVDKLRKVGGAWLFEHRKVMIDWMSEATLFGNLVESHKARLAARGAPVA